MTWSSPLIACYTYLYMVRQTFRASTTYCCVASGYYMRGLWILYAWPLDNICVADKVNNLTGVRLLTLQP